VTKEERVQHLARIICKSIEAQSYCKDCYNFDKCKPAEAVYNIVKQVEQAIAEKIFTDLEEFHAVGNYSEFYVLTTESVAKLKKKYGVEN
jgi:hypothetical protein